MFEKLARLTYRTFTSSRKYGSPYWMDWVPSSPHLVSEVKRLKSDPSFYAFLDQSHACVESLIQAFKTNNIRCSKDDTYKQTYYSIYG